MVAIHFSSNGRLKKSIERITVGPRDTVTIDGVAAPAGTIVTVTSDYITNVGGTDTSGYDRVDFHDRDIVMYEVERKRKRAEEIEAMRPKNRHEARKLRALERKKCKRKNTRRA